MDPQLLSHLYCRISDSFALWIKMWFSIFHWLGFLDTLPSHISHWLCPYVTSSVETHDSDENAWPNPYNVKTQSSCDADMRIGWYESGVNEWNNPLHVWDSILTVTTPVSSRVSEATLIWTFHLAKVTLKSKLEGNKRTERKWMCMWQESRKWSTEQVVSWRLRKCAQKSEIWKKKDEGNSFSTDLDIDSCRRRQTKGEAEKENRISQTTHSHSLSIHDGEETFGPKLLRSKDSIFDRSNWIPGEIHCWKVINIMQRQKDLRLDSSEKG